MRKSLPVALYPNERPLMSSHPLPLAKGIQSLNTRPGESRYSRHQELRQGSPGYYPALMSLHLRGLGR